MGNASASATAPASPAPSSTPTALRVWFSAYRHEVVLFAVTFAVLAGFSSQRFLRQSAAPHFVYQSQAWLEGRLDLDPQVLPNLEDWACVRESQGQKVRCEGSVQPTDRWYVSFPSFPALLMLPFVALHGYQFNDTSFGVICAALAVALFYGLLRLLAREGSGRSDADNVVLALTLAFGTVFFYCAIRGEVWFSAEVLGVAFTSVYARNAVGARRPVLAGVFFSMAVLTRTPLLFSGVFFAMEAIAPTAGKRLEELKNFSQSPGLRKLALFAAGAAPLGLGHAWYNSVRFGSVAEFGHKFLYNNRVNADIDRWGLFHPQYLARNIDAALVTLPSLKGTSLLYSPWGMSLLLTLPLLVFVFISPKSKQALWLSVGAAAAVLGLSLLFPEEPPPPGDFPIGHRSTVLWLAVVALVGVWWVGFSQDPQPSRLRVPFTVTALCCAIPGLFYQNTGYAQFGFRFSLDYTPYLLAVFAVSAWSLKNRWVQVALAVGFLVNFWGAVGFRGYTEQMRGW